MRADYLLPFISSQIPQVLQARQGRKAAAWRLLWTRLGPFRNSQETRTDCRIWKGGNQRAIEACRPPLTAYRQPDTAGFLEQPGPQGPQGDSVAAFVEPVRAILADTKRRKPSAMRQRSITNTRQTRADHRIAPTGYHEVCKPAWAQGGRAASSTSRDKGHRSRGTPSERGPPAGGSWSGLRRRSAARPDPFGTGAAPCASGDRAFGGAKARTAHTQGCSDRPARGGSV
jgi:hypothetical protein